MGSLEAAVDLSREVLGLPGRPQALQVMDRGAMDRLPELKTPRGAAVIAALFSGNEVSVGRKVSQATEVLAAGGASNVATLINGEGDEMWRAVTDLGWAGEGGPRLMVRVGLLPSRVATFVASLGGRPTPLPRGILADPGSGLVRVLEWAEELEPRADQIVENTIRTVRRAADTCGGYAVIERCPLPLKRKMDVWGDDVEGLHLMRRVKREMDPKGILSPGRFVGGI